MHHAISVRSGCVLNVQVDSRTARPTVIRACVVSCITAKIVRTDVTVSVVNVNGARRRWKIGLKVTAIRIQSDISIDCFFF